MVTVRAQIRRQGKLKWVAIAGGVAAVAGAWLYWTAGPSPDNEPQMFGLWQTRHLVVAGIAGWIAMAAGATSVSKKTLFSVLLGSMVFGVCWCLIESAGFIGLVDYRTMFGRRPTGRLGTTPMPHIDESGSTNQDLAARFGIETEPIEFHYQTDRRGFRNEPDRDAADVYLLGDSFLVAALVPFEQTITKRMEYALSRPVMNLSLIGLSVQDERDLLLAQKLKLEDRLVLQFVFEGNDLRDSAAYRGTTGSMTVLRKVRRTLAYNLVLMLQDWTDPNQHWLRRQAGYLDDYLYTFLWTDNAFRGLDEQIQHVLDALGQTRRAVEVAGGSYAVVLIPTKLRVLSTYCDWPEGSELEDYEEHLGPLPTRVRQWCESKALDFLDLTGPLSESTRQGQIPWSPHDTHWNPQGHQAAATAIASWPVVRNLAPVNE